MSQESDSRNGAGFANRLGCIHGPVDLVESQQVLGLGVVVLVDRFHRSPLVRHLFHATQSVVHFGCHRPSIWWELNPLVKSQIGRINSKRPPGTNASIPAPCVTSITLNMARMLPTKKTG